MATYDYMEKECSLWRDTGGHCCPDGTHQKDCVYVMNKEIKDTNEVSNAIAWFGVVALVLLFVYAMWGFWWLAG